MGVVFLLLAGTAENDPFLPFKITPAVTGAFVASAASEKCVRVNGLVSSFATYSLSTYSVHLTIIRLMSVTHTFGRKVRQFRKAKGISQEDLADLCELHRTYIGSVERGERNITLKNAEKIANALKEPLVSFFTEIDNEH